MTHALKTASIFAALIAGCKPGDTAGRHDPAREERVLAGLRGPVEVTGAPATAWSLGDRMAHYKVPGVGIAVIDGGRIVWARGFGVKEAGGADSVTPETLFQAASISKPVAATAMLRLAEAGKLALDENVNAYLTSWQVPDNGFTATEKVTLRRLASHSAGLTVHGFPGYDADSAVPTTAQVLDGVRPANTAPVRVDTVPGARWRYSGGGTTVMQLVMMDVTGQPFAGLMKNLVLEPAGMDRSTYEQPLPAERAPEAARGHLADGTVLHGGWHTYPEQAAAGLWTTPTDLARWALAIDAARRGIRGSLLAQATAAEMLTVQQGQVGLGPFLEGSGDSLRFGHGGSNAGFRAQVLFFPATGQGAAVMSNSDAGDRLNQEILNGLAAEYGWPGYGPRRITPVAVDPAMLRRVAGEYLLTYGGRSAPISFVVAEGQLVARSVALGADPDTLVAVSPTGFVSVRSAVQADFTLFETSVATSVSLSFGSGLVVAGSRR